MKIRGSVCVCVRGCIVFVCLCERRGLEGRDNGARGSFLGTRRWTCHQVEALPRPSSFQTNIPSDRHGENAYVLTVCVKSALAAG